MNSLDPNKTCFVISAIGEQNSEVRKRSDKVFEKIIAPAAKANALSAIRSDHLAAPGLIYTQVIRHLINDKIVIADLTDYDPNVYYELGIRHAFRKPVIQIILSGQHILFDIQSVMTISYELTSEGMIFACDSIKKMMKLLLSEKIETESPITIAARFENFLHPYQDSKKRFDVFLSYAHNDHYEAKQIYEAIHRAGGNAFLSEKSLLVGEDFADEIRNSIIHWKRIWRLFKLILKAGGAYLSIKTVLERFIT